MTEEDYLSRIHLLCQRLPPDWRPFAGDPHLPISRDALNLADEGVRMFEASVRLWCLRGDLIQLTRFYPPEEALKSYQKATAIDPKCAEAYREMGYLYHAGMDRPDLAEEPFRQAIALGDGLQSYLGLAEVLAQNDKKSEALALLDEYQTRFGIDEDIQSLREEIRSDSWSK